MTSLRSRVAIVAPLEPLEPVEVVVVVAVSVVLVVVVVVVVVVSGGTLLAAAGRGPTGVPTSWPRPLARSVSVWTVNVAFGWNVLTLVAPMSPCATTVLICGFAQFGGLAAELPLEPAATAVRRAAETPTAASVASF
jgi:hypothetical protein